MLGQGRAVPGPLGCLRRRGGGKEAVRGRGLGGCRTALPRGEHMPHTQDKKRLSGALRCGGSAYYQFLLMISSNKHVSGYYTSGFFFPCAYDKIAL